MPHYDYRCDACGHEFESFQSISSKPLRKCPECGRSQLQRLLGSGGGILFRGSGFYATDYRGQDAKPRPDTGKPAPAEPDPAKPDSGSGEPGKAAD